jgi:hypothetical protein
VFRSSMSEVSEHCKYHAGNMMTTFNISRIKYIIGDFYCSLSSILGSNRTIDGGNTYLLKYVP